MASDRCTILQVDADGRVYFYSALKRHVPAWLKGYYSSYNILLEESLANECDTASFPAPCLVILDGYKHYRPGVQNVRVRKTPKHAKANRRSKTAKSV